MKFLKKAREMEPGLQRMIAVYQIIYGMFGELYYANPAVGQAYNQKTAEAIKAYNIPPALMIANEPGIALTITEHYATRDDQPLLSKITVPILIINGKQDGVVNTAMAELVNRGIAKSKLILLDDCGHFPFVEQPDKTNAAIESFMKDNPKLSIQNGLPNK